MGVFHHDELLTSGKKRNYFGDGSDGRIRLTTTAAEQSFDGGVNWQNIPGWTVVGSVIMVPSVQDGDMVVVNSITILGEADTTFTTTNRCRGLLIYSTSWMNFQGGVSMTQRGCRANPADAVVTEHTPVAPSDGNAVPAGGLALRRFAEGHTDTHTDEDLFFGCGQDAVDAEAHQPPVEGNGVVITIPRIGGIGGVGSYSNLATGADRKGGEVENGTGGGGSGSTSWCSSQYAGTAGTCFSGGSASAGRQSDHPATPPGEYGGKGGSTSAGYAGGGAGNPNGTGSTANGENGCGALLLLICGGDFMGAGVISSDGSRGGASPQGDGGGGSGAGIIAVLYAGQLLFTGTFRVNGGLGGLGVTALKDDGGNGGNGSIIGPIKIDPA